MTDEGLFTLFAAVAVAAVMAIPIIIARRVEHGEARNENSSKEPSGDE